MSEHWVIVSSGESGNGDDDVSENGFAVVQPSTPPAPKEPNLVQAGTKPANETIAPELHTSKDSKDVAVKEWISTSGVGASSQLPSTAKGCTEDKPKIQAGSRKYRGQGGAGLRPAMEDSSKRGVFESFSGST
jgi:hypothetical protein